jgi:hypothetical protein
MLEFSYKEELNANLDKTTGEFDEDEFYENMLERIFSYDTICFIYQNCSLSFYERIEADIKKLYLDIFYSRMYFIENLEKIELGEYDLEKYLLKPIYTEKLNYYESQDKTVWRLYKKSGFKKVKNTKNIKKIY